MKNLFLNILKFLRGKSTKKSLNENDELAKFVFRINDLRENGTIRPNNLKPRQGEQLSLFEVSNMNHDDICNHGHEHVDNSSKGRVHIGYGLFKCISFFQLELEVIYDNNPPRHVSIEFPDEPERKRELSKALADKLEIADVELSSKDKKRYFRYC